jgi:hypothetical protein
LVQIFSLGPCSQTPLVYALSLMWKTKFNTHTKQLAELWFCRYELEFNPWSDCNNTAVGWLMFNECLFLQLNVQFFYIILRWLVDLSRASQRNTTQQNIRLQQWTRLTSIWNWEKWYFTQWKTPSNVHQFGIMVTYVVVCYCADKSPRFWEYVVVIWPVIDLQRMFFIFGI